MHGELRLSGDTGDRGAGDAALTGDRADRAGERPWIVVVLDDGAVWSDVNDMHVEFSPLGVRHNERGGSAIWLPIHPAILLPDPLQGEAVFVEQIPELRQVAQRHQKIEVFVRSRLTMEQGVHAPSAHHPESDAVLFQ